MDDSGDETLSLTSVGTFNFNSIDDLKAVANLSGVDKPSKGSVNDLEGSFADLMIGQMDLLDNVRRRICELEIELATEKTEKAELKNTLKVIGEKCKCEQNQKLFVNDAETMAHEKKEDKSKLLPSGLYYLKAVQKENEAMSSFYRCSAEGALEITQCEFGPFPSSGLFKLLYHPNGKNVILVSPLLEKALGVATSKQLKFELDFVSNVDVNFTPKRSLFTLSQNNDKLIRLQSESDPALFIEAVFESREIHSSRFAIPSGINCRLRRGSEVMMLVNNGNCCGFSSSFDRNPIAYYNLQIAKSLTPKHTNSPLMRDVFKIVFNDDESASLYVNSSGNASEKNVHHGLEVKSIMPAQNGNPSDHLYLTLSGDESIKICPAKFELFVDKAYGSIRLFTAHGKHFVTTNGKLERFAKASEVIEFFIEKI